MRSDRWIDFIAYRLLTPWRFQLIANLYLLELALYVQTVSMSVFCLCCSMIVWSVLQFNISSNSKPTPPSQESYGESFLFNIGSSKYKVPMVVLSEKTPYENGFAMGVMFKDTICRVVPKCSLYYIHEKELEEFEIPQKFRDEIQGMSDATGVNVEYFIAMCAMAERNGGCTTICSDTLFGRNLDWLPLDISQESVVVYFADQGLFTLTVPGLLCGPTIWTDTTIGAVNTSPQHVTLNENGQSMLFHFRSLMEISYSEKDVFEYCRLYTPFSPYHFTFEAHDKSLSIEFSDKGARVRRPKTTGCNLLLDVYNFDYHGCSSLNSYHRKKIVESTDPPINVSQMINLLVSVQSWITCHTVVATDKHVFISFANGYSASAMNRYIRVPRWVDF